MKDLCVQKNNGLYSLFLHDEYSHKNDFIFFKKVIKIPWELF